MNVGPGDFPSGPANGREQLFVDSSFEPQVGPVADELDVVDDSHVESAVIARSGTVYLHDVAQDVLNVGVGFQASATPWLRPLAKGGECLLSICRGTCGG